MLVLDQGHGKVAYEDRRRGNEEPAEVVTERSVLCTVVPSISL